MEFKPLFFGDKLSIRNPEAQLGITCLWSSIDYIDTVLENNNIDASFNSKIALVGNLFGNGFPQMLRNLLYNPQVNTIVIFGSDRSGSAAVVKNFFSKGITTADGVTHVTDTSFILDDMVTPDMLDVEIVHIQNAHDLKKFITDYIPRPVTRDRVKVPMPVVNIDTYPSDIAGHSIIEDSAVGAYEELLYTVSRFGRLVTLKKGDRQELQNFKVVIRHPDLADADKHGYTMQEIQAYQQGMFDSMLPMDQPYTYGHRIGAYYGYNFLDRVKLKLTENPQDRSCYLALWNSFSDMSAEDAPCLVSLFFRVIDDTLTLTACYRTHNAVDGWLKNVFGIIAVLQYVAAELNLRVGTLTTMSHSISIDPARYTVVDKVIESRGFRVNLDTCGYFIFDVADGKIVVSHMSSDGNLLKVYSSGSAERLQHELYKDKAISDIGHAIYVGRMLAQMETRLGDL